MSCFSGSFDALPGVRCDRFERFEGGGGLTTAEQFFLSHCHTDHMKGLSELAGYLRRKLRKSTAALRPYLFCSNISKAFVQKRHKNFPDNCFYVLKPNEAKEFFTYDSCSGNYYKSKVTGIGANHCPGSLMFLFEKLDGNDVTRRILYTGDFRFDSNGNNQDLLRQLTPLHDPMGNILPLDEMYLDTTFCSEQYETFPTRMEAEEKIWNHCDKWIRRNGLHKNTRNAHVILLTLPARYGYERILQNIYKKSMKQWRVHINEDKFEEYLCTNELAECAEPDHSRAQWIHACTTWEKGSRGQALRRTLPCQPGEFEVCQIKPSAAFFTKERMNSLSKADLDPGLSLSQGVNYYRVCYSAHSSLTELRDFVMYFSPKKIVPCAIPRNSSRKEVANLLESFMESSSPTVQLTPKKTSPLNFSQPFSTPTKTEEYDETMAFFDSPDSNKGNRCAELRTSLDPEVSESGEISNQPRVSFDQFMDMEERQNESSEEEGEKENTSDNWNSNIEIIPGIVNPQDISAAFSAKPEWTVSMSTCSVETRRNKFAHSRVNQTYYSMPVQHEIDCEVPKERRSSMPSNMKLPVIRVTPSSPSPDPDDPDYPEFFQSGLYLEHVGRRAAESNKTKEDDLNAENEDNKECNTNIENKAEPSNTNETETKDNPSPAVPSPLIKLESRRIKRQQSMRSYNEDEYGPSLDFKKPKLNILSKMGKSFDSSTHLDGVQEDIENDEVDGSNSIELSNKKISSYKKFDILTHDDNASTNTVQESKIEKKRKFSIFQRSSNEPEAKYKVLVAKSPERNIEHDTEVSNDNNDEFQLNRIPSPIISGQNKEINIDADTQPFPGSHEAQMFECQDILGEESDDVEMESVAIIEEIKSQRKIFNNNINHEDTTNENTAKETTTKEKILSNLLMEETSTIYQESQSLLSRSRNDFESQFIDTNEDSKDDLNVSRESLDVEIVTIESSEDIGSPIRSKTPDIEEVLKNAEKKKYSESIMKNLRALAEDRRRVKENN